MVKPYRNPGMVAVPASNGGGGGFLADIGDALQDFGGGILDVFQDLAGAPLAALAGGFGLSSTVTSVLGGFFGFLGLAPVLGPFAAAVGFIPGLLPSIGNALSVFWE